MNNACFLNQLCDAVLYLVAIPPDKHGNPTKAPISTGWNKPRSSTNPNGYSNHANDFKACEGVNFGLYHADSNTMAFDIDDMELTRQLFEDTTDTQLLDWLEDDLRLEIKSPKANRGKLIFKVPPTFNASLKQLKYKNPSTQKDEMVFELRAGNCQDVIHGNHPEGGLYQLIGNPKAIPEAPPILLDMLEHWVDWKPVFNSALGITEPPKYKPYTPLQGENIKGYRCPIKEFNQSYAVSDVLIRNGYKPTGKDRFIRPNSSSKAPAVAIMRNCADDRERAYSHGGDALNDGYAHDAFDCMRLLEYRGVW